ALTSALLLQEPPELLLHVPPRPERVATPEGVELLRRGELALPCAKRSDVVDRSQVLPRRRRPLTRADPPGLLHDQLQVLDAAPQLRIEVVDAQDVQVRAVVLERSERPWPTKLRVAEVRIARVERDAALRPVSARPATSDLHVRRVVL